MPHSPNGLRSLVITSTLSLSISPSQASPHSTASGRLHLHQSPIPFYYAAELVYLWSCSIVTSNINSVSRLPLQNSRQHIDGGSPLVLTLLNCSWQCRSAGTVRWFCGALCTLAQDSIIFCQLTRKCGKQQAIQICNPNWLKSWFNLRQTLQNSWAKKLCMYASGELDKDDLDNPTIWNSKSSSIFSSSTALTAFRMRSWPWRSRSAFSSARTGQTDRQTECNA